MSYTRSPNCVFSMTVCMSVFCGVMIPREIFFATDWIKGCIAKKENDSNHCTVFRRAEQCSLTSLCGGIDSDDRKLERKGYILCRELSTSLDRGARADS